MPRAAAKKGVKRNALDVSNTMESKKLKVDPVLEPIIEVVEASSLSPSCKAMLAAALPNSLRVASDSRTETQARLVGMAEEVITSVRAQLQATSDNAQQSLDSTLVAKDVLLAKVKEAELAATAAKDEEARKSSSMEEAKAQHLPSCEALRAAQETQKEGDAPLYELEARCKEIRAVIERLKTEGPVEELESSLEVMRKCDAAESLLVSIPSILAVLPAERSDFQNMVVKEAEKCLIDRMSEHSAVIDAGVDGKNMRAAAVEEAKRVQEIAKETWEKSKSERLDAEVSHQNAIESLRVANKAVSDFDSEIARVTTLRDEAKAHLDRFDNHNFACFNRLRSLMSTDEPACQAGA